MSRWRLRLRWSLVAALLVLLAACASGPPLDTVPLSAAGPAGPASPGKPQPGWSGGASAWSGAVIVQAQSRWVAVPWSDLPGLQEDDLFEAWNAWLKSCERPGPVFAPLCPQVRQLSIADRAGQLQWMQQQLQPYRVEPLQGGPAAGLLTGYFEPEFEARRLPGDGFSVPLYSPPATLVAGKPWFTRRDIDTLPQAQAALRGKELVYLADPVDALLLQVQGSGRLRVTEPDGQRHLVRLAYAANNGQPYKGIGRWLLDQGELRGTVTMQIIRAWARMHPERVQQMLDANPRVVFFRAAVLDHPERGPTGAMGVPLTPLRSVAVDKRQLALGTPLWLSTTVAGQPFAHLVFAQDVGGAITGSLRADLFFGTGETAGDAAGRMQSPGRMWVLLPRGLSR
ncbi:membrane-bound lytic murein transglycosylase A precursor [mine drainage metagenome]|uniref:peptidoglycan lytic exotransglycosylase n=1 Tax=mine drainage metagenome TaxID=410659 RepID=A0A1J5RLS5_9ZZZZ